MVPTQPIPRVTHGDVERLARRDYPDDQVAQVLQLLGEYGTVEWEGATARKERGMLEHQQKITQVFPPGIAEYIL